MKQVLLVAGVVLAILAVVFLLPDGDGKLGVISSHPSLGLNTSTTVGATAIQFLTVKSDAQLRRCYNTGVGDVTYGATTTQLVAGKSGDVIKASSSLILEGDSLWTGDLWGVTSVNATTVMACTQF